MRAIFLLFLCGLGSLHASAPVVSDMSAAQRASSRLVNITSDVAADFPAASVGLQVSSNGGSTFTLPDAALNSAIGVGATMGTEKKVTWDAGEDWSGQYSTQMRFKAIAADGNSAPKNMALIPQGGFTMGDSLDGISDAPTRTVALYQYHLAIRLYIAAEAFTSSRIHW